MNCPICTSGYAAYLSTKNNYPLYKCTICAFIFVCPAPTQDNLKKFYEDFYDGATTGYFKKREKKIRRAYKRVKRIKRRVPHGHFLDVGCNGGFATEAARMLGFDGTGIDIDPVSINYARDNFSGNAFYCMSLEEFSRTEEKVDILYCSEIIEHVSDVHSFTGAMAKLIKNAGIIYITTPDSGHFRTPANLFDWQEVKPPEHLQLFNKKTIRILFAQHGLKIERIGFNLKPGLRVLASKA